MKRFTDEGGNARVAFENADDIANNTLFFSNIFVLGLTDPIFYAMTINGELILGDHNKHLEGVITDRERLFEVINGNMAVLLESIQDYANVKAKVDLFGDMPFEQFLDDAEQTALQTDLQSALEQDAVVGHGC